jgi:prepilin-type processing-associated H-X9-DG protein
MDAWTSYTPATAFLDPGLYAGMARKPVHGATRNFLFFDSHVGMKSAKVPGADHY